MDDALVDYLMEIVTATRENAAFELGVSPRGALALYRAAQALAFTEDRDYCIADDIKRLVVPVCAHRVVVGAQHTTHLRRGNDAEKLLTDIVNTIHVPI